MTMLPSLTATEPPRFSFCVDRPKQRLRRVVDTTLACFAMLVATPVLVAAACAIALEDGAPVVFRQRRVGRYGRHFTIYKLRTMRRGVGDQLSPRGYGDRRVTRVGAILRKTSVDELPQLLNVIRGEMALIGPRPEMPFVVAKYENWQHMRHLIAPGITGLWQTTARKMIALERPEATVMDIEYLARMSPWFDAQLIARTALAIVRPHGAF